VRCYEQARMCTVRGFRVQVRALTPFKLGRQGRSRLAITSLVWMMFLPGTYTVSYSGDRGSILVTDRLMAGALTGQAPCSSGLWLGNSSTLQDGIRYAMITLAAIALALIP